jgi:hypothetical protein
MTPTDIVCHLAYACHLSHTLTCRCHRIRQTKLSSQACTNYLQDIVVSEGGGEKESQLICKLVNPPPDIRELPVYFEGSLYVM